MSQNSSHLGLKRLFAILLGICATLFACCIVAQTTVLNEQFMKQKLQESTIIQQSIDQKLDEMQKAANGTYDISAVKQIISSSTTDKIENVAIELLYHPDNADTKYEQMRSDIISQILSSLTDDNDQLKQLIQSPLGQFIGLASIQIKEDMHYNDLKSIGYVIEALQIATLIGWIVTGLIALASLVMLFVLNRRRAAIVALAIAGSIMTLFFAVGMLIPLGEGNFSSIVKSIQANVAAQCGYFALGLFALAIISGVVSVIINKKSQQTNT